LCRKTTRKKGLAEEERGVQEGGESKKENSPEMTSTPSANTRESNHEKKTSAAKGATDAIIKCFPDSAVVAGTGSGKGLIVILRRKGGFKTRY